MSIEEEEFTRLDRQWCNLLTEGLNIIPVIIGQLNVHVERTHGEGKYRTRNGYNEIALALALYDRWLTDTSPDNE